jgi:hypothetical protein
MNWRVLSALAESIAFPEGRAARVRPLRRWPVTIALVTSLCACSNQVEPTAKPSGLEPGQYQASGGKVCAANQPLADVSDGFGTDEPARVKPAFPRPHRAWICRYQARIGKPGADKHGRYVHWHFQGAPTEVARSELPRLQTSLDELHPWRSPRDGPTAPTSSDLDG